MGYLGINNRKATEWVDHFRDKYLSPDGDRIYIANVRDQRDTDGSLTVWYSVNDELQHINNQTYQGYLRLVEACEDQESLEQVLTIDSVAALDRTIPKEFFTGVDEVIKSLNQQNSLHPLTFSQLVTNVDHYVFGSSYLDSCGFFGGQPAYINRVVLIYEPGNSFFDKTPNSVSDFDKQDKAFCKDVLRISEYLRQQYIDVIRLCKN
jgi:hypothetical protein